MLPNLFSASPFVWAGLATSLVALPILIHLINLMRHRTVEWAAMEFLLKSYRKNRNWIWLKQLLLLLSRIAMLLLLLLIFSQMSCQDSRVSRLMNQKTTHHFILLDDSYSMSDQTGSGTVFDRALGTTSRIIATIKNRSNQKLTLLPLSRISEENALAGELVDQDIEERFELVKQSLRTTALAVSPLNGIQQLAKRLRAQKDSDVNQSIVYVLSDFRKKDWNDSIAVASALESIEEAGGKVQLISCSKTERNNLSLVELRPQGNVRVAGIPVMYELAVKNHGSTPAMKVQVRLNTTSFQPPDSDTVVGEVDAESDALPTIFIEKIDPGETVHRDFAVYFPLPGDQVVQAKLPDDPIEIDNVRYSATRFANAVKVLLLENEPRQASQFISLSLNPGNLTGLSTETRQLSYVRDTAVAKLREFDVIFSLDPTGIDPATVAKLEEFVGSGGGLAIFLGPNTNARAYNELLYRQGKGLLPYPLNSIFDLPETESSSPDVVPKNHPIFPGGLNNAFLQYVKIKNFFTPLVTIEDSLKKTVNTIATVRGNNAWPLISEQTFGNGHVIMFSTSASTSWNNWAKNATFPPLTLLVQNYLAKGKYPEPNKSAGGQIERSYDVEKVNPNSKLVLPAPLNSTSAQRTLISKSMQLDSNQYFLKLGGKTGETEEPGIIDLWFDAATGQKIVERIAINVTTDEGELQMVARENLRTGRENKLADYFLWDQYSPEPEAESASDLAKLLLVILVVVIIAEHILAYQCSFHPSQPTSTGDAVAPGPALRNRHELDGVEN